MLLEVCVQMLIVLVVVFLDFFLVLSSPSLCERQLL